MTGPEEGFLLLTSRLGNPERRVLSAAQVRVLAGRVRQAEKDPTRRELEVRDLLAMGYGREAAQRIMKLLEERELLRRYCAVAARCGCTPLTWAGTGYPRQVRQALGDQSPGCLWYRGDRSLLEQPMVALVGSRDILPENRDFAAEVGRQAALQGYVLVSGNARGADQAAQRACLRAGGRVICVVADRLDEKPERADVLFLSEDEFDAPFTAQRAISRNRVIHALAQRTFVAQCGYREGGTWDGTVKNLREGWSSVYCFHDRSPAQLLLAEMGAQTVSMAQLGDFSRLERRSEGLFDPNYGGKPTEDS